MDRLPAWYSEQDQIWKETAVAVALEPDGTRWIGNKGGIVKIELKQTTFAQKAEWFEQQLHDHFWRLGFIASDVSIDDPWNPTEYTRWDKDNDGLWTQMQIGAWCAAYAVTGEERYYESARKAIEMMMLQTQ